MKHCFETCEEPSCTAGAPCKKLKRRVRAGEAQPSNWVEIEPEPELPIDMAEPDREPIDRRWFVAVLVVMALLWGAIYWRVML